LALVSTLNYQYNNGRKIIIRFSAQPKVMTFYFYLNTFLEVKLRKAFTRFTINLYISFISDGFSTAMQRKQV